MDTQIFKMQENLTNLKKDTVWKISDFEELLKTRATETFIETTITDANRHVEQDMHKIHKELLRKIEKLSGVVYSFPKAEQESFEKKEEVIKSEKVTVSKDENIKTTIKTEFREQGTVFLILIISRRSKECRNG